MVLSRVVVNNIENDLPDTTEFLIDMSWTSFLIRDQDYGIVLTIRTFTYEGSCTGGLMVHPRRHLVTLFSGVVVGLGEADPREVGDRTGAGYPPLR